MDDAEVAPPVATNQAKQMCPGSARVLRTGSNRFAGPTVATPCGTKHCAAMPRYFFHLEDGHSAPDEEGAELRDIEEARAVAVRFAGDYLKDQGAGFWAGEDWRLIVTDADGLHLFAITVFATIAAAHPA
jgi:hypothetical protein